MPSIKLAVEGQAGELAEQVDAVVVAVHRVVEHGVGVGEDVLGADAVGIPLVKTGAPLLPVVVVDLAQAPLGDVADPLAVGGVAVEGEALGVAGEVPISQLSVPNVKCFAVRAEIDDLV